MRSNLQALQETLGLRREEKPTAAFAAPCPYLIPVWVAMVLYAYRSVLVELVEQWQIDKSYSHGPVVIPIATWLLWKRRSTLPPIEKPWGWAIGLLLISSCMLWLGQRFHVPAIQRWSIPVCIGGMIGLSMGRRVLAWSLPGVCFLAFMIPIPFRLEMIANEYLQYSSAWCSCYALSLTKTFAVTDGYTLKMASGQLGITEDCSGLRMTIAIAALAYMVTFLTTQPTYRGQSGGKGVKRIVGQLSLMMLLVIPAAIVANAARIAVVAWVMDHFRTDQSTAMAHDIAGTLVLPLSVVLLVVFRFWVARIQDRWRKAVRSRDHCLESGSDFHALQHWGKALFGVSAAPMLLAIIGVATAGLYRNQRTDAVKEAEFAARSHEQNAEWDEALSHYRDLIALQPWNADMRYRYAWVSLQSAETLDERTQAFFQLEAFLKGAPQHREALRTHLQLALEQNNAKSAIRSAERLYEIERRDANSLRLCIESMLRFSTGTTRHPAIAVDGIGQLVERLGPTSQWREQLVVEMARYCCDHADSIAPGVTRVVEPALGRAVDHVATATAFFQAWRFEHIFGNGLTSIERARIKIDSDCPADVVYRIYLASAGEALVERRPDDAKEFLRHAIRQLPSNHIAYEQLGDLLGSQGRWNQGTVAYLRAWRLSGDRPIKLGIKLAEALIQSGRYQEFDSLVMQLLNQESTSFNGLDRGFRIRLMIVQAQREVRSDRHANAMKTLRHCQSMIAIHDRTNEPSGRWLPAVETLEAQCLVRMGRYDAAARLFEHRATHSVESADQWIAAARAWRSDGNLPAAERCYRSAVADLGYDSEVWLESIGLLKARYGNRGAIEEIELRQRSQGTPSGISDKILAQAWELVDHSDFAIQHYRQAAELAFQDVAGLAIALARNDRSEEAVACLSDPRWPAEPALRAHTAAVVGVQAVGLTVASKATLEEIMQRAVEESSHDTTLLLAMVRWYMQCHNTDRAKDLLEHAIAAPPGNVIAGNNLAMLLAEEKHELDRAMKCIDSVLERTGPIAEFLDTKGWILLQMDRPDDAIAMLNEASMRSDSTAPHVQLHLAAAYFAVGNRDQARGCFKLATGGDLRPEHLHPAEQRAWTMLQDELGQPNKLTKQQNTQQHGGKS